MLLVRMGFRNLLRRRGRSALTGLSLVFSLVLIGLTVGLNEGSYDAMIEAFTRASTGHVVVQAPGFVDDPRIELALSDPDEIVRIVSASPFVEGFFTKVHASAMAFSGKKTSGIELVGIRPEKGADLGNLGRQISSGSLGEFESGTLLLGAAAAQALGLSPGSEVALLSQGADGSVANGLFRVAAILGKSASEMWSSTAFLHLSDAQDFLSLGNRVHELSLVLHEHGQTRSAQISLANELARLGRNDAVAHPWWDIQKTFHRTMKADKETGYIFVYVIVLMSGLVALNTTLMMILERTRELGVLSALGTRPLRLFFMIVVEVLCLASASIVVGEVVNLGLLLYFHHVGFSLPQSMNVAGVVIDSMKSAFTPLCFWVPAAVVGSVALLVSIPPAVRAARMTPMKAIRKF